MKKTTFKNTFTLIELMVAIAIMMILAGLVINGTSAIRKHNVNATIKAQLQKLAIALENYKTDWGFYPDTRVSPSDLIGATKTLQNTLSSFKSPNNREYLENLADYYKDPMDTPYFYISPGAINTNSYDLWSIGVDTYAGTTTSATWSGSNESTIKTNSQTISQYNDDTCDDISNWKRN